MSKEYKENPYIEAGSRARENIEVWVQEPEEGYNFRPLIWLCPCDAVNIFPKDYVPGCRCENLGKHTLHTATLPCWRNESKECDRIYVHDDEGDPRVPQSYMLGFLLKDKDGAWQAYITHANSHMGRDPLLGKGEAKAYKLGGWVSPVKEDYFKLESEKDLTEIGPGTHKATSG